MSLDARRPTALTGGEGMGVPHDSTAWQGSFCCSTGFSLPLCQVYGTLHIRKHTLPELALTAEGNSNGPLQSFEPCVTHFSFFDAQKS